jgi:hypothetical protein
MTRNGFGATHDMLLLCLAIARLEQPGDRLCLEPFIATDQPCLLSYAVFIIVYTAASDMQAITQDAVRPESPQDYTPRRRCNIELLSYM